MDRTIAFRCLILCCLANAALADDMPLPVKSRFQLAEVKVQLNLPTNASQGQVAREADPWARLAPHFSPPQEFVGQYGSYRSPLKFADGSLVRTAEDWKRRRDEIQKQWTELLGTWPALIEKPQVEMLESMHRDNFTQHRIRFRWTPQEFTSGSDPDIMFDTDPNVNYWEPWYLGWHPRAWRTPGVITPNNPGRGLSSRYCSMMMVIS